jgi:hypothetical protein
VLGDSENLVTMSFDAFSPFSRAKEVEEKK